MIINVKAKKERIELKSGDIVEMKRNGMANSQFYVVTGEDYLINIRCGRHRYKRHNLNTKDELLTAIKGDNNVVLVDVYAKDKWSLDLIEKGGN